MKNPSRVEKINQLKFQINLIVEEGRLDLDEIFKILTLVKLTHLTVLFIN